MRTTSIYILVMILVIGLGGPVLAAEVKIGTVDFQRIVEQSEPGQKVEAGLKQEGERMEADLEKEKEELKNLQAKIEREAAVMSQEAREEKEIEFRVKVRNLQEKEKRYRAEFVGKQRQEVDGLRKVVLEIAQEIGKKEGYTLVISNAGVLYQDPAIDLTEPVIKILNKRLAGK